MDYSNIKSVKKRIFTSLLFILAILLVSRTISHLFYEIQMLLRWATIIAIGFFVCNAWGAIVGYNTAVRCNWKIKCLENDLNEMKRITKK